MYCAECGSKMERHPHGAWIICCNGWGYCYDQPPTPEDSRNYGWPVSMTYNDWLNSKYPFDSPTYWFYPTAKWPKGRKVVWPKVESPKRTLPPAIEQLLTKLSKPKTTNEDDNH